MRTVRRNAQKMKYALYLGSVDVVATDYNGNPQYYKDGEGNIIYLVTGEKRDIYGEVQDFEANISMSGSEAEAQEYGLSLADYSAVLIISRGAYPIVEGTIIWTKSEVEYDGEESYYTTDMQTLIRVRSPQKVSSDFVTVKVSPSLNFERFILDAINK